MNLLIDILRGAEKDELKEKGYDKLKTYGVGKDLSYKEWKEYLYQMLQLGYIEIDYMSAGHLKVTPLGRKVLFGEQQALMTIYQKIKDFALPTKKGGYKYRPIRPIESTSVDETLLDSLQQLRKQIAEREHTPLISSFRMTPSKIWSVRNRLRSTSSAKYEVSDSSSWTNTARYSSP